MLKYLLTACMGALLLALCSSHAVAKSSEPEPNGIQAGGFVMHPGADASIGYDVRDTQGEDDGLAQIGVHFRTKLADEKLHSWDNNVAFNWRQYWGLGNADPDGGYDVKVSSVADIFKTRFFRIAPSVSYAFLNEPEDDNLRADFKNHHVIAGAAFYIQPSAGAVFSQRLGYQFNGRFYSEHSDVSNMENKVDSVTRWNFLPQSSMALEIDFRAINYLEDNKHAIGIASEDSQNASSYPIRIKYSLQGLLFARLSYILGLGYAYENYDNGLKEHLFIMNARLRYDFTSNSGLYVEYKKDFDNIVYGDYYKYHRVILGLDALWFEHLQTDLNVGYGNFDYRTKSDNASRIDNLITAQANIYYHFFPGLKLGVEYRLRDNLSDVDYVKYCRHLFTLNFAYEY
ncbi:MAG: hypothetical protein IJM59_07875 [Proteobacteria bacterium]|nr:hypothetical protein [Pseudomonadota bacterium]